MTTTSLGCFGVSTFIKSKSLNFAFNFSMSFSVKGSLENALRLVPFIVSG